MTPGQDPAVLLVHGFASSAEHNWRQPGWLALRGVDHFGTPGDVRCMQAVLDFLGC
jgi:pimeloyl-ACP methyl ester carboxylesterase